MIYGFCRVSTPKQNVERQIRNIRARYPDAVIVKEICTGTQPKKRKTWLNFIKMIVANDTIVFDSVSRMSRTAEEGFKDYQLLFYKDINLVFLNEPHINTEVYKKALNNQIALTGTKTDIILKAINEYLMELAKEQILIAFEQAEKEVEDLHRKTKEGIETARLNGAQIGQRPGAKLVTKKSLAAKADILKYSKSFKGCLNDAECMRMIGISRNTYYKYKKELALQEEKEP